MYSNMYCPYCGNRELRTIWGKDPDYGVHITAWTCPSCASTFRDPDDIRRFIKWERIGKIIPCVPIAIVLISGVAFTKALGNSLVASIVGIISVLVAWGCYRVNSKEVDKRIDKLEADLRKIEAGLERFAK